MQKGQGHFLIVLVNKSSVSVPSLLKSEVVGLVGTSTLQSILVSLAEVNFSLESQFLLDMTSLTKTRFAN